MTEVDPKNEGTSEPDPEKQDGFDVVSVDDKDAPDPTPVIGVVEDKDFPEEAKAFDPEADTLLKDGPVVKVPEALVPGGNLQVHDKKAEQVVAVPAPFAFKGPFVAHDCDVLDSKNVRVARCGTDSNRVMNGPRIAIEVAKAMNKAFP